MTLSELLAHATVSFAGAEDRPAVVAILAGRTGEWQIDEMRPITGVRLGEDEVLVETGGNQPHLAQLTAGELLSQLRLLLADYPDRPVEACEPGWEVDDMRFRIDYPVVGSGRDNDTGTCLLACYLAESTRE